MSDQDNFSTSEATENQVFTPPFGSNTTSVSSAHFVGRRNRSDAWDGFTEEQNDGSKRLKSDRFDQEACQNELVKMFVATDIPISFVENKAFLFSWTSCQDQNYMCLTAHFIDNNWKLHKKILNFLPTVRCSVECMESTIEWALNDWELSRVFSLTADNVSPYDYGVQCLKKRLMSWNTLVLKGDYIHMQSCAHILNMILKEALEDFDHSILKISDAVQCIRSTPVLSKFEACAEQEKIEYKGYAYLDVETKWNLSHEMLEAALKHQKTFEELELQDKKYVHELEKGKGVPTYEDWYYV